MATEKKWIITFFVVIMVWFGILFSTLYQWANGVEVLVDDDYDLSYITLPLMGFAVLYSLSGIFIFAVYLLKFNTVEKRQRQKFELVEREKERERERYIRAPDTRMSGILESGNVQAKEKENLAHTESLSTSKISSSEPLDDITLDTALPNSRFGAVRYIFDNNITSGNVTDQGHNHVDKNESLDGRDKKGRQSYYDDLCSIVIPSRNEESVIRK